MIFKNSIIIAFFSIASVLLGILRDRLLATNVGVGSELDIYNAAFRIPDFLYALSVAFVTSGTVVPFLTVEDKSGHMIDSRFRLSSIVLFFIFCMIPLAIIVAFTLPLYAYTIVPGFSENQVDIFVSVTRLLLIQPILLGITSLISCFGQSKNHFILFGISPLGYSLGIIFGVIILYPLYGVSGLIFGVIGGAITALFIQLFSLRNSNFLSVLPYFSKDHIKELIHTALPRTGVNILTQVRNIFFTAIATTLGSGVLSAYLFAQRIMDSVVQIIQQSVTTASIPVLSKDFIEKRLDNYTHIVRKYVATLGLMGVFLSFLLFFIKKDLIVLLYGNTEANNLIEFFLIGFIIILPFHMMSGYFSISFYSAKDTKRVFYANLLSTFVSFFVWYFSSHLGKISLVYAFISMAISQYSALAILYTKKKL